MVYTARLLTRLTTVVKRIQTRIQTMQESSHPFFTWTAAVGEAFYCARSALQIATRPVPFLPVLKGLLQNVKRASTTTKKPSFSAIGETDFPRRRTAVPNKTLDICTSFPRTREPNLCAQWIGTSHFACKWGPRVREDDVNYCNFESRLRDSCLSPTTIWRSKLIKTFIRDSNAPARERRGNVNMHAAKGPFAQPSTRDLNPSFPRRREPDFAASQQLTPSRLSRQSLNCGVSRRK